MTKCVCGHSYFSHNGDNGECSGQGYKNGIGIGCNCRTFIDSNTRYEKPTVTFVGSDPKIPALAKAIKRAARIQPSIRVWDMSARFVGLWQARNRRTRVLIERVRRANAA